MFHVQTASRSDCEHLQVPRDPLRARLLQPLPLPGGGHPGLGSLDAREQDIRLHDDLLPLQRRGDAGGSFITLKM